MELNGRLHGLYRRFLASTKQLWEQFCPSIRLSRYRPNHENSGVITIDWQMWFPRVKTGHKLSSQK